MKLKIRLFIADLLNRNNNYCWADLVGWAYGFTPWDEIDKSGRCKRAPNNDKAWGGCYCGKHKAHDD